MITMARYLYQLLLVVDFSRIKAKAHATDAGVDDYKKYLAMSAMVKKVGFHAILFSPSDDMDAVWHAHILDTRSYRECCELLLGPNGSIDHDPYGSEDPRVRQARRSFAMMSFHSIFGEHPKQGWGPDEAVEAEARARREAHASMLARVRKRNEQAAKRRARTSSYRVPVDDYDEECPVLVREGERERANAYGGNETDSEDEDDDDLYS